MRRLGVGSWFSVEFGKIPPEWLCTDGLRANLRYLGWTIEEPSAPLATSEAMAVAVEGRSEHKGRKRRGR